MIHQRLLIIYIYNPVQFFFSLVAATLHFAFETQAALHANSKPATRPMSPKR